MNLDKKSALIRQVTGGCVTGTALALKPPIPQGRGRARLGVPRLKLADFGLARACRKLVFRPAYILPVSVSHFASFETLTRPVHAAIKQIALTEARRPGELGCLASHAQLDSVSFR